MKKHLLFLIISCITITGFGQDKKDDRSDFWEHIRTKRIAVFTQNIELTSAEAQQFWPVYNSFDKERIVLMHKRRSLDGKLGSIKSGSTEAEYKKIATDYVSTHMEEARLIENYNNRFLKILPAEKVCRLYQAERKFREYLMEEMKKNQAQRKNK